MDIAVEVDKPARELSADLVDIRDPAGFEHAYERYRLPVYRYLRARAVHDEDALDLTATTFGRAFAKAFFTLVTVETDTYVAMANEEIAIRAALGDAGVAHEPSGHVYRLWRRPASPAADTAGAAA